MALNASVCILSNTEDSDSGEKSKMTLRTRTFREGFLVLFGISTPPSRIRGAARSN